jgi:hypothetical protein
MMICVGNSKRTRIEEYRKSIAAKKSRMKGYSMSESSSYKEMIIHCFVQQIIHRLNFNIESQKQQHALTIV